MFGISIEEITLLFTILVFIALVVNAMIISRALEMLMDMYENKSGLAAMERAVGGFLEFQEAARRERYEEFEDDWL